MTFDQTKRLPFAPLVSKRRLEILLRCDRKRLIEIAEHSGRYYKPFDVRRDSSGKWRHIDNPTDILKDLQSRIYRAILADFAFLPNVVGGIPGRSIRQNVEPHIGQKVIVTFDIRKCFPSIDHRRVFHSFRTTLGFSAEVASILTKLTTFHRHLPQGAPSSSIIANLVMVPLHLELERIARAFDLRWTIYIDDVTISGRRARDAMASVIRAMQQHGFAVGHRKIHVMTNRNRQCITGVIVNRTLSAGRRYRIEPIRKSILDLRQRGTVTEAQARSTMGKVQYVRWLNDRQGTALARFAEAVMPEPVSSLGSATTRTEWRRCKSFSRDHTQ